MIEGEWLVVHRLFAVRQQVVEPFVAKAGNDRRQADGDADKRSHAHGEQHVEGRFLHAFAAVVTEEGKIGNLDSGVLKHTG